MIIKKTEGLVLTSKGLEQLNYNIEEIGENSQKLISYIETENLLENIITFVVKNKINPQSIQYLIGEGFIEVAPIQFINEVKEAHKEEFTKNQNNDINDGVNENEFDEKDFTKGENFLNSLEMDAKNITVLNDKNTLHTKSVMTKDKNSYVDLDSLSALSPEKRGFEEIKVLLKVTLKKSFPLKHYYYNYQISKLSNMKELNNFLNKIMIDLEKKDGKDGVEELMNRISTIKYNSNLSD